MLIYKLLRLVKLIPVIFLRFLFIRKMLIEITDNAFSCLEINKTYYIELKDYILNAVHDTKRLKYKLYRHRYFKTKSSKNETVIHEKLPGKKIRGHPPLLILTYLTTITICVLVFLSNWFPNNVYFFLQNIGFQGIRLITMYRKLLLIA